MRARGRFIGEGVHEHRKIGLMIRDSLTTNAAHVSAVVHGDGLTALQYRKNAGNTTEETKSESSYPDIIQIERKGDTFIMSVASFGEPFETVKIDGIKLNDTVFAGLFICSHNAEVIETAVFNNVRLIIPVKEDFIPYTDYIGSNIEIMDIESGLRKILYTSPFSLQAPNWTNDWKQIVFVSFPAEVKSDDHPFYKHVYIRLVSVDGEKPKIIACVYGGQGSINVPSWSPDSKKIAFVSNTGVEK